METVAAILIGMILGFIIGIAIGQKRQQNKCNCDGNGGTASINDDPSNDLGVDDDSKITLG